MDLKGLNLSLLVAYTKSSRVIGAQGKIPWKLSSERNRFKKLCNNKFILMGRKSFEEIGHGLPYCTIIIVSKSMKNCPENCLLANSIQSAIKIAEKSGNNEILVAGGEELYNQTLPYANKIYATEIDAEFSGDRFFPQLTDEWIKSPESEIHEENNIQYEYVTYVKKSSIG